MSKSETPSRGLIIAGFLAVYLIWGSTYLGIAFAIETIPPFAMASIRFLLAGSVLFAIAKINGVPNPTRREWRSTAILGALLLFVANSGLVWAEKHIASGLVALLVAIVPLWMVLFDWMWGGSRPTRAVIIGVIIGFGGIIFLIGPEQIFDKNADTNLVATLVVVMCSVSWSIGSIYSRHATLPKNSTMTTAAEMLSGGVFIGLLALVHGDWGQLDLAEISFKSGASLVYLAVFGSIVAFSAYVWILKVSTPARVATYAYVNPVVALFLGWAFADEEITPRTFVAAGIILGAVFIITVYRNRKPPTRVEMSEKAVLEKLEPKLETKSVRSTGPIQVQTAEG